jgi:protein tyrosine/serine phosphatase
MTDRLSSGLLPSGLLSSRRRSGRLLIGVAALGIGLCLAPLAAPYINNNFHVVADGEAYRSAQPSPGDIRRYFAQHRIATILNLRGASPGSTWYDREVATSSELGIQHVDFRMKANRVLTSDEAKRLEAILETAPRPLLIHCRDGADRTGLVASLFSALVGGGTEQAAEDQLSIFYGHYALPLVGTWEMDVSWENLEPTIGFPDS